MAALNYFPCISWGQYTENKEMKIDPSKSSIHLLTPNLEKLKTKM